MHSKKVAETSCTISGSDEVASAVANPRKIKQVVDQVRKEVDGISGLSSDLSTFNRAGTEVLLRR